MRTARTNLIEVFIVMLAAAFVLTATFVPREAAEHVSSRVQPNTCYILRVEGFANGPAEFKIVSKRFLPQGSANENAGTFSPGATSGATGDSTAPVNIINRLVRFTINPLTRSVNAQLLR